MQVYAFDKMAVSQTHEEHFALTYRTIFEKM